MGICGCIYVCVTIGFFCMCIRMHMYTYAHVYVCTCIRMHMYTYAHAYVCTCIRMHISMCGVYQRRDTPAANQWKPKETYYRGKRDLI